jgi:hypothetical protein
MGTLPQTMTGHGSLNADDLRDLFSPFPNTTPYDTRHSGRVASARRDADSARFSRQSADMHANGMHMHYNHEFQPRHSTLARAGGETSDPLSQHHATMGSDMHDRHFHNGKLLES